MQFLFPICIPSKKKGESSCPNASPKTTFGDKLSGNLFGGKTIKGKTIDFKPQGPAAGHGRDGEIQRKPGRFWKVKIY